jgi:hypothetical protein
VNLAHAQEWKDLENLAKMVQNIKKDQTGIIQALTLSLRIPGNLPFKICGWIGIAIYCVFL